MRLFLLAAAVLGFLSVAEGAFGAHALRDRLTADQLRVYETAVRYEFLHALALLAVGLLALTHPSKLLEASGWLMLAGTAVFSGSLLIVSLFDVRWLGAVTPFGGLLLLAGWVALAGVAWGLR